LEKYFRLRYGSMVEKDAKAITTETQRDRGKLMKAQNLEGKHCFSELKALSPRAYS
jgi:hypothetical protein